MHTTVILDMSESLVPLLHPQGIFNVCSIIWSLVHWTYCRNVHVEGIQVEEQNKHMKESLRKVEQFQVPSRSGIQLGHMMISDLQLT